MDSKKFKSICTCGGKIVKRTSTGEIFCQKCNYPFSQQYIKSEVKKQFINEETLIQLDPILNIMYEI